MANWVKWLKDKTFLTILGIVAATMLVAFAVAFFRCGWVLSIVVAVLGGIGIRKVIIKRINRNLE